MPVRVRLAPFRSTKAAVILDTLLGLRGSLPAFIHVSDGKLHDVNALDLIVPEPGAIYVMDRAYVDFRRLFQLHQAGASFVTRAKKNLAWHRVHSSPKDREHGIQADQLIALDGKRAQRDYPVHLRRVRYRDPDSGKRLVFLANRRDLEAVTICALCKQRWQVELFSRWMMQITSENEHPFRANLNAACLMGQGGRRGLAGRLLDSYPERSSRVSRR